MRGKGKIVLTFEQIKELIDQVASHRLTGVELERSGFRLKIDGQKAVESRPGGSEPAPVLAMPAERSAPSAAAAQPVEAAAPSAAPAAAGAAPAPLPANIHVLESPIVGTFYRAPNPDSPSYVEVGDRVKTGQVLCIVEAMKLMNEIESDVDGTIAEVYIENVQAVEYGEPLFAIKVG